MGVTIQSKFAMNLLAAGTALTTPEWVHSFTQLVTLPPEDADGDGLADALKLSNSGRSKTLGEVEMNHTIPNRGSGGILGPGRFWMRGGIAVSSAILGILLEWLACAQ